MPFEISVPEGRAPVTSRPHRLNPILAKEVNATLIQYLAAGLIQHSTSPYSSPLVVIPKRSGGVRITVNYKKLNQTSKLSQLPIPRVVLTWFLRSTTNSVLHTDGPLRMARYASGQQRFAGVVRKSYQ